MNISESTMPNIKVCEMEKEKRTPLCDDSQLDGNNFWIMGTPPRTRTPKHESVVLPKPGG